MSSQRLIRPAESSDAPAVVQIYVASWNAGFQGLLPPRTVTNELIAKWAALLADPGLHRWWIATTCSEGVDAEITGFVGIGPSRDPVSPGLGELDTIQLHRSGGGVGPVKL